MLGIAQHNEQLISDVIVVEPWSCKISSILTCTSHRSTLRPVCRDIYDGSNYTIHVEILDVALTWIDVLCVDGDVSISVRSALLMPSAEGVEYLVHHNTFTHTRGANGDVLLPSPSTNR